LATGLIAGIFPGVLPAKAARTTALMFEEFVEAVLGAFAADAGFLHAAEGGALRWR
jgi:hypothetical protein